MNTEKLIQIIFESSELLVINKQADLACHPTKGDAYPSLIARARLFCGSPGALHMVNRLDRETSGVVVIAKHRWIAADLRQLWSDHLVLKQYLAITHGWPDQNHGMLGAAIGRDETNPLTIKDCVRPDGVAAETEFFVEKRFWRHGEKFSLLKVVPTTGRKHQIRIHLASYGCPIVGDKIYGHGERMYLDFVLGRLTPDQRQQLVLPYQALHAREVRFSWRNRQFSFRAEPEQWFVDFHLSSENQDQPF